MHSFCTFLLIFSKRQLVAIHVCLWGSPKVNIENILKKVFDTTESFIYIMASSQGFEY